MSGAASKIGTGGVSDTLPLFLEASAYRPRASRRPSPSVPLCEGDNAFSPLQRGRAAARSAGGRGSLTHPVAIFEGEKRLMRYVCAVFVFALAVLCIPSDGTQAAMPQQSAISASPQQALL